MEHDKAPWTGVCRRTIYLACSRETKAKEQISKSYSISFSSTDHSQHHLHTRATRTMSEKIPIEHVSADVALFPSDTDSSVDVDGYGSNSLDKLAMTRMGKIQQMRRNFKQISLIGFTCMCMCTWEWMIMSNSQGLINGGGAALFWGYIWTFVGYGFIAASLADMASMAPVSVVSPRTRDAGADPRRRLPADNTIGLPSSRPRDTSAFSPTFPAGSLLCPGRLATLPACSSKDFLYRPSSECATLATLRQLGKAVCLLSPLQWHLA